MASISQVGNFYNASDFSGRQSLENALLQEKSNRFETLLKSAKNEIQNPAESSAEENASGDTRLPGDIATGFSKTFTRESDRNARPSGFAANSAERNPANQRTIDKTSKLYEKSLELESFFVKMMVDSMRKTVVKADGGGGFAQKMYEDMLYDEYTTALTKNAGLGIADAIYLQLSR